VEGSHSNKTRTTSTWPFRVASWMGRSPHCYEKEARMRVIRWDTRNKQYIRTEETDISSSKQYQLRSTYPIRSRNCGRIPLQQHTNHFHMTITSCVVDGKAIKLFTGKETIHKPQKKRQQVNMKKTRGKETQQPENIKTSYLFDTETKNRNKL